MDYTTILLLRGDTEVCYKLTDNSSRNFRQISKIKRKLFSNLTHPFTPLKRGITVFSFDFVIFLY